MLFSRVIPSVCLSSQERMSSFFQVNNNGIIFTNTSHRLLLYTSILAFFLSSCLCSILSLTPGWNGILPPSLSVWSLMCVLLFLQMMFIFSCSTCIVLYRLGFIRTSLMHSLESQPESLPETQYEMRETCINEGEI